MKNKSLGWYVWLALVVVYLLINFLVPPSKAVIHDYNVSLAAIHIIDLTVLLPIAVIWYLVYFGFVHLNNYYRKIDVSKDGQAFKKIAVGVGVFAYGSPASGVLTAILQWIVHYNHGFMPASVILTNYIHILVPLIGFFAISQGVGELMSITKLHFESWVIRLLIGLLVCLGTSYTFLTFHHNNAAMQSLASNTNAYYLPNWLILFTIVVPYVFVWSIGIIAVIEMSMYKYKVKGVIYRDALNLLAIGLGFVLISYIAVEYLTSLTNKIIGLRIGGLLAIIYCFLIVLGAGYLLIAVGARRLKKLEDV